MDTPAEGNKLWVETLELQDVPVTGQSIHEHKSVEGVFQASNQEKLPKKRNKGQKTPTNQPTTTKKSKQKKPPTPGATYLRDWTQSVGWASHPRRKWSTGLRLGCHKQVTLVMLALDSPPAVTFS